MRDPFTAKIAKGLGLAAVLLATVGLVLYVLALAALNGIERTETPSAFAHVSAAIELAVKTDGGLQVVAAKGANAASGHPAALASADIVGKDNALLTTSADGSVRVTRLDALHRLDTGAAGVWDALHDGLWAPYAGPLADWSLWIVSQVLPLHVPETRMGQRGRAFRDCPECPEMVEVSQGMFFRGAPLTEGWGSGVRALATVSYPLAVGRFPVTFDEWDACVQSGGCQHRPDDYGWGRGRRPVVGVSWDDAKAYVKWLSGKTGGTYRLLSSLEWEYVARAGTTTDYWWGSAIGAGQAHCDGCGSAGNDRQTVPVGSFKGNRFGLYDTSGNVWHWTEDCSATVRVEGRSECLLRGLRGGSWRSKPHELRSAYGASGGPSDRLFDIGFRVARELGADRPRTAPSN